MFAGRIVGEVAGDDADERSLGLMMAANAARSPRTIRRDLVAPCTVKSPSRRSAALGRHRADCRWSMSLLAFVVAGLIVLAHRRRIRWRRVQILLTGAFGSGEGLGYTLYYATNFIFTGLAVAVAFHAGLFNIGGEGQAYIGGLGVGLVAAGLDHSLCLACC